MYEGPGIYEHYKGGHYRVWGIGRHERFSHRYVLYTSLSVEHEVGRQAQGVDFVARPLDDIDGPDAFNKSVSVEGNEVVRFRKVG
jgi:hypothetical protein